jgi:antitoxin component YwqK of YwqJK toxin-antitoxin module
MYLVRSSILLLIICFTVSGCSYDRGKICDYELYENGNPKKAKSIDYYKDDFRHTEYSYSHVSEYFENGNLKLEEWSVHDRPEHRLEFYENGRLKSEERFINGKLDYGIYYTEDGQVERKTGELIDWITQKRLRKPE